MKPTVLGSTLLLGATLVVSNASAAPAVGPEFSLDPHIVVPGAVSAQAVAWDGSQYFAVASVSTSTDTPTTNPHVLHGVRVDASGTVLDPGGIPIYPVDVTAAVAFGAGYFLVATSDCHVVRVRSDGTVVDTTPISLGFGNCASPSVSFDGTNFLVSVVQPIVQAPELVAWRVTPAGTVLDSPLPIQLSPVANGLTSVSAGFNGSSHTVVYEAISGAIGYANIKEDGTAGASGSLATGSTPVVACDSATGCLAVWAVKGASSWTIQGAQIGAAAAGVFTLSKGTISTSASPAPTVSWDGTHYLVVWSNGSTLLGARVTGSTVVDTADIVIQAASQVPTPAMASQPSGSLLLYAATATASGFGYPSAQAVRLSSALVEQGQPFPYSLVLPSETAGTIASNGAGYLTSWTDYTQFGVRGCRLDASGTPVDSPPLVFSATGTGPVTAALGSTYLLVWNDYSLDPYGDIYGALVPAQGSPGAPFAISARHTGDQIGQETNPGVAANGTGYLVTWNDDRNSSDGSGGFVEVTHTYAARVSAAGVVLDSNGVDVVASTSTAVASDGTNYLVLATMSAPPSVEAVPFSAGGAVGTATGVASPDGGSLGIAAPPRLTFGGGKYLAVWSPIIGGLLPTSYGSLLAGSPALSASLTFGVCSGSGCSDPYLVGVGDAFYATWFSMHPGSPSDLFYDVYGTAISSTGVVLSPPNGELVSATTPTTSETGPIIALRDGSHGVMLYNTQETDGDLLNFRMRARLVSFDGGLTDGSGDGGSDGGLADASSDAGTSGGAPADAGASDGGASASDATTTNEDATAGGGDAQGPTNDASSGGTTDDASNGGSFAGGGGNSSGCTAAPSGRTGGAPIFDLLALAGLCFLRRRRP